MQNYNSFAKFFKRVQHELVPLKRNKKGLFTLLLLNTTSHLRRQAYFLSNKQVNLRRKSKSSYVGAASQNVDAF